LGPLHTDVVRWAHLQVSVDGCDRNAEALERVRQAVEQAIDAGADGRLLACRIELTGRTDIHDHLLISTEHLLAEARATALGFGDAVAWIERIVVATEPVLDPAILAGREDALGELHRMLGDAGADAELLGQLEADISELVRKLPSDLGDDVEDAALKAAIQADYPALISHVRGFLNARLATQED
jgi:DNA repair protein SbcD/Mre11